MSIHICVAPQKRVRVCVGFSLHLPACRGAQPVQASVGQREGRQERFSTARMSF